MFTSDPPALLDLATALRRLAQRLADCSDRLHRGGDVPWVSTSAHEFRAALAREATLVSGAADDAESIARDLALLGEVVADRQHAIRAAQRAVGQMLDAAQATIGRVGGLLAADAATELGVALATEYEAAQRLIDRAATAPMPAPDDPDWISFAREVRR